MKRSTIFVFLLIFIAMLFACVEPEPDNETPTISITSPSNNSSFILGETVTITVNAEDLEDELSEVRFYANNIGMGSAQNWPYEYDWETGTTQAGNYTIKAEAIDGDGLKSEAEISIELQDPASFAIDGVAYFQPDDGSFDIIALHEDEGVIAIDQSYDGSGEVTFIAEEGADAFHVWVGSDGLPTQAYINGNFILFSNYGSTTIDVAIVRADGEIEIIRGLDIGNILDGPSTFAMGKAADASDWLRWGGHALSVAGCAASIAGTVATGGAMGPLAWIACGATVVSIVAEFVPEDEGLLGFSAAAIGNFAGAAGCVNMVAGNVYETASCWAFISSTAITLASYVISDEDELSEELTLAGGALESGSGDVQITLTWNTTADLDLRVTDPHGEMIYFGNRTSQSGGWLDVDDMNGYGPENVYWPTDDAPNGSYLVQVNHWSGTSPTNYSVLVQAFGHMQTYSGTIYDNQTLDVVSFSSYGALPLVSKPVILYLAADDIAKIPH